MTGGPDEWFEIVKKCEPLPENDMKQLCEMVKQLKTIQSSPNLFFIQFDRL